MTLKQARKVVIETRYNVVVTNENPFKWVEDIELNYTGDILEFAENLAKIERIEKTAKVQSITWNAATHMIDIRVTI